MWSTDDITKNRSFYDKHDEFRRFVNAYCQRNEISVEEATTHIQITETRKYYEDKDGIQQTET